MRLYFFRSHSLFIFLMKLQNLLGEGFLHLEYVPIRKKPKVWRLLLWYQIEQYILLTRQNRFDKVQYLNFQNMRKVRKPKVFGLQTMKFSNNFSFIIWILKKNYLF